MSFIPRFQHAGPGTVVDLVAAATRSQIRRQRAAAVVAEPKHWFPKTTCTDLDLPERSASLHMSVCVIVPAFFCYVWLTFTAEEGSV